MSEMPKPFSVLGLPVHLLEDYSSWLLSCLHQHIGVHVVTLNAEMAIQAEQNPALAEAIYQADLVVPDGSGVVLYLRLRGKVTQRCPGIELVESLLLRSLNNPSSESSSQSPWSVFFYGGAPGVAQQAAVTWQQRVPGIQFAGTQHGYLSPQEEEELLATLKATQPRIICVGLGVPRQELWILQHRHLCPESVWVGVGGSLDIWAGNKERAPVWLRENHLEWMYRLYQEPHRWRRMLALPQFAWRALWSA
ncbi:MAG: WecB/TagA/CpsF family glycosyltransferase [Desertifilum sp. SIO1I2]|nr:WecB/TagA/CpsF family glycosyltransferase [Desertifilum sp. SIO1I2]